MKRPGVPRERYHHPFRMKNTLTALLLVILALAASPWLMESSAAEQTTPAETLLQQAPTAPATLGDQMKAWQKAMDTEMLRLQQTIDGTNCAPPAWQGECPSGQTLDSVCANNTDFEYTDKCQIAKEVAQNNADYLKRRLQELKDEWAGSAQSQAVFDTIIGEFSEMLDSSAYTEEWLEDSLEAYADDHAEDMAKCCK